MLIKISYYYSRDSFLGVPEHSHDEFVECKSTTALDKYIEKQKDEYGNPFKKKSSFGFQYISNQGGIKTKELKIKNIN